MNELLKVKETMSSLQIAEITGKRHDAVLRDIKNLLSQGVNAHNFVAVEYIDKKGELRPCYQLTKKGCLILASGYNAKLREKIIDRWEELETGKHDGGFQVPQSFSEALQLAADQAKQIEEQQKQIEQKDKAIGKLQPKADFADAISYSTVKKNKEINEKFAVSGKMSNFATLTDGNHIYLAGQAVKLLNDNWAFFIAQMRHISGCLLRRYLLFEVNHLLAAQYGSRFPMPITIIK